MPGSSSGFEEAWAEVEQACSGAAARFRRLCEDPRQSQLDFLQALIRDNAGSRFGRDHDFADIATHEDFAASVPISGYAAFKPYVERLIAGGSGELTQDPVLFAELTGGSTGGSKTIPYTQGALDGYAAALRPWLSDLLERLPRIKTGRAYFALSPVGRAGDETIGAIPMGSPEQFDYFGAAGRPLSRLSIAPPALAAMSDFDQWQFATCLHLLAAKDLTLVWVWSPTYLSELLHAMRRRRDELVDALASPPDIGVPLPAGDRDRAAEVARLIDAEALEAEAIWPDLTVISCWMDASSAPFAAELQRLCPHVAFQPKALMATEGATTLPFGEGPGAPIALESGFFEFADDAGRIARAWELQPGEVRRVIVSNRSGFYRYDTEDLVEVAGFEGATPRLRFVGRAGRTSDLCGEKLSEHFVLHCLSEALGPDGVYAFLAPRTRPHLRYELWIDSRCDAGAVESAAARMEAALGGNPQYAYARRLGQLQPLAVFTAEELYEHYCAWALAHGREIGHLKAPALLPELTPDLLDILRA